MKDLGDVIFAEKHISLNIILKHIWKDHMLLKNLINVNYVYLGKLDIIRSFSIFNHLL